MTTPTGDRRDLVTVFASMRAAPGKEDELRRWLESVIEPTTQEAGCVNYHLLDESGLTVHRARRIG